MFFLIFRLKIYIFYLFLIFTVRFYSLQNLLIRNMTTRPPYQQYLDWGEKRYEIVEKVKHQQPSPINWIKISYPEEDFIELYGQQDKKPIKIKTYRHKVSPQFQKPKAILIFFHHIGMTTMVSGHFAQDISKKGYETVGMDLRGHGKSGGEKGYIDSAENVLKDVENFIKKVKELYSDLPIFILGDGVGCLITLNLYKGKRKLPIKGLIFAGPSFARPQRSKVLAKVSEFSLKLLPNKTGIFPFLFENYSRNPNVGKILTQCKYLYHDKVCVGSLQSLLDMTKQMDQKCFQTLQIPEILIIQGQNDKSADAYHTIRFYEKIKVKKELLYYKEMWHTFLMEKEYGEIRDKIINWLDERL